MPTATDIERVVELLKRKWTIQILLAVRDRPVRLSELKRAILISSCAVISPASSDAVVQRHIQVMWQGFRVLAGSTQLKTVDSQAGMPRRVTKRDAGGLRNK